jgi:cytochrome c553
MSGHYYMFIMKLNKIISCSFLAILVSGTHLYAAPLTDLDNQHNLSSSATHGGPQAQIPASGGTDEICIFCHAPHSAVPATTLWSRPDPDTATFPLYANALAIKGELGAPAGAQDRSQYKNDGSVVYPSGASRLCLSCHDGVTSIGTLNDGSSIAMVGGVDTITGVAAIDLSTSHPISFVYDNDVLADVIAVRGAGTYQLPPDADGIDTPLDGEDKMQCTTCHDPHDDTSLDGGGLPPFWRHTSNVVVDEYDDVCAQCHIGGSPTGPSGDHDPGPGI